MACFLKSLKELRPQNKPLAPNLRTERVDRIHIHFSFRIADGVMKGQCAFLQSLSTNLTKYSWKRLGRALGSICCCADIEERNSGKAFRRGRNSALILPLCPFYGTKSLNLLREELMSIHWVGEAKKEKDSFGEETLSPKLLPGDHTFEVQVHWICIRLLMIAQQRLYPPVPCHQVKLWITSKCRILLGAEQDIQRGTAQIIRHCFSKPTSTGATSYCAGIWSFWHTEDNHSNNQS